MIPLDDIIVPVDIRIRACGWLTQIFPQHHIFEKIEAEIRETCDVYGFDLTIERPRYFHIVTGKRDLKAQLFAERAAQFFTKKGFKVFLDIPNE